MMDTSESINAGSTLYHTINPDVNINLRAIIAECLGTAIFVFFGTAAATFSGLYDDHGDSPSAGSQHIQVALAHAFGLMAMIHTFGPISGAHFNPAVTLSIMITRNIGVLQGLLYIFMQFLGGIIGAAMTLLISIDSGSKANLGTPFLADPEAYLQGFALEIILTFVLALVMFGSNVKSQHLSVETGLESMTPLFMHTPIAFTVGACALAGQLTGAAMNPARAFGPMLLSWTWDVNCWIYYAAPPIGALVAGLLFEFILTRPRRSYIRIK